MGLHQTAYRRKQNVLALARNQPTDAKKLERIGSSSKRARCEELGVHSQRPDFELPPFERRRELHQLAARELSYTACKRSPSHFVGEPKAGDVVELVGTMNGQGKLNRKGAASYQSNRRSRVREMNVKMAQAARFHPMTQDDGFDKVTERKNQAPQIGTAELQCEAESFEVGLGRTPQGGSVRQDSAANSLTLDVKGCGSLIPFFGSHAASGTIRWIYRGDVNFEIRGAQPLYFSQDESVRYGRIPADQVRDSNWIARWFKNGLTRAAVRVAVPVRSSFHQAWRLASWRLLPKRRANSATPSFHGGSVIRGSCTVVRTL